MSWFSPLYRGSEMHADRDLAQTGSVQQIRRDSVDGLPLLLSEISEFWFANQEGDNVPDWSQFSPQTHPKLLPHIVFWEIVENSYFARITGETVRFLLPVKLSNRRLHDVLTDDLSSLPAELDQAVADQSRFERHVLDDRAEGRLLTPSFAC